VEQKGRRSLDAKEAADEEGRMGRFGALPPTDKKRSGAEKKTSLLFGRQGNVTAGKKKR